MSILSDYNDPTKTDPTNSEPEEIEGKFDEWEKHGYSSFSKKLKDSNLDSSKRKEIDKIFKEEMVGGKTRSNSQILSLIKKKYGSGKAMKIKSALTPRIKNELSAEEKKINVILGKQASDLRDKRGSSGLALGLGKEKKNLSERPRVGFGGFNQGGDNDKDSVTSTNSGGSPNPLLR
ncbi:MAG: hypothetical protein K9M44_02735 [Candidatus Pacebacteria bacterium]|nr:hypothetical protein [Candidatus Paceibacterota bacterium]